VGALLAALRRAASWPAWVVLAVVVVRAAVAGAAERPFDPAAPARGVLAGLGSPRLAALLLGLWGAGALLGAALRVLWLSGALPTLGAALSGAPREPRFASGVAYAFPRVLAAAALGLAADAGGSLFGIVLALSALRAAALSTGAGGSLLLAAAGALALTLALFVPAATGALVDAAVARAALRAEWPAQAFAGAGRRFLARPGTFLLAACAFSAAGTLAPLSVEGMGSLALGFAQGTDPVLLLGPNLMLAAAALAVGAAVDLWWLGTVSALACGRDRE
jgi:hypothetical protein